MPVFQYKLVSHDTKNTTGPIVIHALYWKNTNTNNRITTIQIIETNLKLIHGVIELCIYLKNNPTKIQPDPICNDKALGSFTSPQHLRIHLRVSYLQFRGATLPIIWFSCLSCLCTKNMTFLTSSHSAVSNTLFI